jgi:hypothetical protein
VATLPASEERSGSRAAGRRDPVRENRRHKNRGNASGTRYNLILTQVLVSSTVPTAASAQYSAAEAARTADSTAGALRAGATRWRPEVVG